MPFISADLPGIEQYASGVDRVVGTLAGLPLEGVTPVADALPESRTHGVAAGVATAMRGAIENVQRAADAFGGNVRQIPPAMTTTDNNLANGFQPEAGPR